MVTFVQEMVVILVLVHNMVVKAIPWLKYHLEYYIITSSNCRYAKYAKNEYGSEITHYCVSCSVSTHVPTWFSVKTIPKL